MTETPHLYTFHALRPGADLTAAVRALSDGSRPVPDAEGRRRRRALADALARRLPDLVEEEPEGDGPLELTLPGGPDGEPLLEILVEPDVAELTLTVVPGDPAQRRHFSRAWEALRALDAAGLVAYDEQTGRVLDLRADLDAVVARFETVTAEVSARERRPWWRFW